MMTPWSTCSLSLGYFCTDGYPRACRTAQTAPMDGIVRLSGETGAWGSHKELGNPVLAREFSEGWHTPTQGREPRRYGPLPYQVMRGLAVPHDGHSRYPTVGFR